MCTNLSKVKNYDKNKRKINKHERKQKQGATCSDVMQVRTWSLLFFASCAKNTNVEPEERRRR